MGVATKFTIKQTCQKVIDGILGIAPKEKFVECNYTFYNLKFICLDSKGKQMESCPIELPSVVDIRACQSMQAYDEELFFNYIKNTLDKFLSFQSSKLTLELVEYQWAKKPNKIISKYKSWKMTTNVDLKKELKKVFSNP